MFSSSILPGVSTNVKFMHNPSSKPSNRYVKSSTNPNMTYLANPNLYDLGYHSILPTEGPPANWYPNSSYNSSYGQDYAIYSSNSFNYDQPTQYLDFEDVSSIGTESPAMSTASLETLKSPVDPEPLIDQESENRVTQTSFPFPIPSQVAPGGRTISTSGDHMISSQHLSSNINVRSTTPFQSVTGDQMPRALHPSFPIDLFEDGQSTISELEVDERDRIAKINAEYNAISHAGSLDNTSSPPKYSPDRLRDSQLSLMHARHYPALSASQPRHPDLHFPPRQIGNEKKELTSSPYRIYASPVVSIPHDLSPPIVERLPSQLPPEQNLITVRSPQSQSLPPASNRNPEGTSDLNRSRIIQNAISSPTSFIHSDPQTYISKVEKSQTLEPSSTVPTEIPRKSTSPLVNSNGYSPQCFSNDVQESLHHKQQSRSGAPSLIQLSTTAKNHSSPHNASPDSRQYTGILKLSSLHPQINDATELESTERTSLGSNLRGDTKTPGLPGRGLSYIQPIESPSPSSQIIHSSPDMRNKDSHKSSPKSFLDEKSGHVDNCRSPGEASLSSSDSSSSSVSPSNRPLPREDIIAMRRTTKDADHDRGFERHRRLRTTGAERTVSTLIDDNSRGTAPMHTRSPLHLSPEGSLATFLQPDSQVESVTTSERWPTDLRNSKTLYDQASTPNSLDSRESRKVHERQYINFGKPQSETAKHERMLSAALQSSPVNKSATTSSSLPSKTNLDFPPTPVPPEPHRRHSDGDQVGPPIRPPLYGRNSAPLVRSVRWTDNLIAPSPILTPPRRKGWFNRRGDQLWTNTGDYRPPRSGEEYPLDLDDYPELGDGWMNEDGVRIDMSHCRVPKALPRPALKKL